MYQLHIPVSVQKLEKIDKKLKASPQIRKHVGTVYFPDGTTANEVCVQIQKKEKNTFGLWLLQKRVNDARGQGRGIDDTDYITIKDSKHVLEDGTNYVAIHYSGMDIELIL